MFARHTVVSCRPPRGIIAHEGFEAAAISHCAPNLDDTVRRINPKVIVPMGNVALQRVAGVNGILRYRGRIMEKNGRLILPTFHPRDLLPKRSDDQDGLRHPPRFVGVTIWDLKRALHLATDGKPPQVATDYLLDPEPHGFSMWADAYFAELERDPETRLSWDIETPYKLKTNEDDFDQGSRDTDIIRISFAYTTGEAVSVPWDARYLPIIRRLLASFGPMVVWNGDTFDVPLVRKAGVVVNGRVEDYMWAFHMWQSDLPKGLEWSTSFFSDLMPWKHLNNDSPALYSAIDSDAALRIALGLTDSLKSSGMWDVFQRHVVDLDPLLYEAGERGNLIDTVVHERLKVEYRIERDALVKECQGMIPPELFPRKRYKRDPVPPMQTVLYNHETKTTGWQGRRFQAVEVPGKVKQCSHCGEQGVKKTDHFKGGKKNPCKVASATIDLVNAVVTEWDEILPFNPNSSDQIKGYIRHFKHPMGKQAQDREKDASDSKHLKKLAKKYGVRHPLYEQTIKIHKVSKALSTYVLGFAPDEQGLVHTTYDHTPSTWRVASKNVNLMNVGKRDDNKYAKAARDQIIAHPRYIFVGADSSAIEAVMVGHFMNDPEYIDLARRGIHDFLTCFELGIPFTPEAIKEAKLADEKGYAKIRYKCKRVVHGTAYGMGPKLMVENDPEAFPNVKEAKLAQEHLFEALPGLKAWQHLIRVRAHKETYLQSPWGYRHYFYDVFSRDARTGKVVAGKDANKAVAFLPQNSAAAFGKDNLNIIGASEWRQYVPANIFCHDGYVLEVPIARKHEAARYLKMVLTRPIEEMGGLRVGCEIEMGYNWGTGMETIEKVEVT